jgi:hypothetical protein
MVQDFIERQIGTLETERLLAEHYVVILSGHGGGATGDFLPDEDPHSALTIPQLGRILREAREAYDAKNKGQRSDIILGLDSCLMSMAEVAYEVRDSASYLVGAEGFVPNTGWPYHRVVEALADGSSPEAAAEKMVEKYAAFYQDYEMGGVSTHLAAIDLSEIGNLASAVKLLATQLREQLALLDEDAEFTEINQSLPAPQQEQSRKLRDAMILAHWYAQCFKWGRYVDLYDFCDQLLRFLPDKEEQIRNCCDLVKRLTKTAVKRSYYTGPDFQHAHGLSVYFPWSVEDFSTEYLNLKFARETGWYDLVVEYLRRTRRLRRGQREFREPKEAVPWKFGSDVDDKLLLNSGELTGLARADAGLLSRVDFRAQSRADAGLLSRADTGLLSRADTGLLSRADTGLLSRADTGLLSRADTGLLSRADTGLLSRVVGGKLAGSFQNTPDGFYRQRITGDGEIFIAKNQEELDKKKYRAKEMSNTPE